MREDEQESRAEAIAREAFGGTADRGGRPAILHVERVARAGANARERTVGWLHDLVEDTATTLDDLRREGFDDGVIEAVNRITRRGHETYREFIERVACDELATRVKLNDLDDNRARCGDLPELEAAGLARRYDRAIERLRNGRDPARDRTRAGR